jgi:hypothetical protein
MSQFQGAAALQTVRSEFQFLSQLLSDGRPYICGQHLTAADIAFVALALPVLSVPYATTGPVCDASVFTPPPEMTAVTAELRGNSCVSCVHCALVNIIIFLVFFMQSLRCALLISALQAPLRALGQWLFTRVSDLLCCSKRANRQLLSHCSLCHL